MAVSRGGFDTVATVVDWLDACRSQNLDALLDLYADGVTLECECEGPTILRGRTRLADYWRPKLACFSHTAFRLDELSAEDGVVTLEYQSHEGKSVRIRFRFDSDGKIKQTQCAPTAQMLHRQ